MKLSELVNPKPKTKFPAIAPGDTVKVNLKVVEGDKERIQSYQGVVIRLRKGGAGGTFTVRRVAYGIGIERTFPVASPLIDKVQIIRHGDVRRAKLYYLRGLSAKKARIKEKRLPKGIEEMIITPEPEPVPEPAPVTEQAQPPAENKQ
jgi:large subunit ribosomal protein L19